MNLNKYSKLRILYNVILFIFQAIPIYYLIKNDIVKSSFTLKEILQWQYIILFFIIIIIFIFGNVLFPRIYIFLKWKIFKLFLHQNTFLMVHELIHLCRAEIIKKHKGPTVKKFIQNYLLIIRENLLQKLSRGFTITFKKIDSNSPSGLTIFRCPKSQERSAEKYDYDNPIEDNPFINSICTQGFIILSKNIEKNKLDLFTINNMKLKYSNTKEDIPPDVIEKCSKYYKSICNYPVKVTFSQAVKNILLPDNDSKISPPKHMIIGVLTIDHKLPYLGYYLGKKLVNLLGFITDLLFSTIFISDSSINKGED